MNRKISEFPRIPALQDGYLVPAVRDGVSFVFDTASLKSYLTKADMGLSAVDNTSDINKPISTATQTAISGLSAILFNKTDVGHLHSTSDISGLANMFSGYSRTNHTHTVADITDLVLPNMSLYATVQDVLARTTEARVLQLITQNTTGAVDLGPTNVRIDNAIIRIAGAEANVVQNQITANTHSAQISSVSNRVDALEATGLDTADLQTINNQFAVLTNSLSAKASITHTHTTSQITDFAATVGNLISSVVNVNAINADLNGIHADLLAIYTSLDGKAATTHIHAISNITGLQAALDAKSGITHVHDFNGVTGLQTALDSKAPTGHTHAEYAPTAHNHTVANVTGLQTALDGKAATGHTHTEYAASVHTHAITDTIGLEAELASKAEASHAHNDYAPIVHVHSISSVTGLQATLDTLTGTLGHTHAVADITGLLTVLETKTDVGHEHIVSNITGLQTELDSKADASHLHTEYADIAHTHIDYAAVSHNHSVSNVIGLQTALDDKAATGHGHSVTDISGLQAGLDAKAGVVHIHGIADVTGLQTVLVDINDQIAQIASSGGSGSGTSAPLIHTHALIDITGLQTALDAKASSIHGHVVSDVTGLQTVLDSKTSIGHVHETSDITGLDALLASVLGEFAITSGSIGDASYNSVVLLLHGDGANGTNSFADSSSFPGTLTTVGSVVHTTTYKKFGTSSIQTSDKNSKIQVVKDVAIDLTASYTIECFVRTNSNTNVDYNSIITTNDNVFPGRFGLDFGVTGSNTLVARIVTASNSTVFSATNAYTLGNLIHIAFVNDSVNNLFKIFIGGELSGTRAAVPFFNTNVFQIGKCSTNWAETPYQIDELRITKNVVRYLTNFTPPATAFANAAPTTPTYGNLATALASKASLVHTHAIADTTGLQTALDAKASSVHGHVVADVTGLQTVLDNKASVGHTHTEYAAILHNHALIDITGLQTALDAKASVNHTHVAANITDFNSVVTDIIDQQIIASNSSAVDTYYSNVVLLLHGTGANNSTTIVDSSTSPKSISVIGNTVISTSQSKFNGSSLYFDGSGDYLNIATSQDFDLGDIYTIEFFVYNLNATAVGGILHKGYYSSITHLWSGFAFSIRGVGAATRFYFYASTNLDEQYIDVPASLPQNAWQHVAMVRNGSSGAVYLDGVPSGTITGLNTTTPSTEALRVGLWDFNGASEYFNGHLAEVRVTKGVARYIAAFTPPAIEFPNTASAGGTPGMLTTALTGLNTAVTNLSTQIAANADGLGYGQSWQTVTRVSGTTYVNTTGKPIVFCYSAHVVGNTYVDISVSPDGIITPIRASYGQGHTGTPIPVWCSAVIPVGAHYIPYTNGTFFEAVELR